MSTRTSEAETLASACGMFLQDLQALPDEAFTKSFGPKTRTVADIVYEVNLVNDHIGMVIRNEKPFDWPEGDWIHAPAGFDTKGVIIAAFQESSSKIISTADAITVEEMQSTVETEHGQRTRAERCRFMALHLWYHSGQLNFIQTMLGDDAWHWS